jgi:YidC/Oxa1 family membrane protein insertase
MADVWDWFLGSIFGLLQGLYSWARDYGFAIILLTVAMRIVLTPLTWKQTKSMYELQRVQPKIKALQEKHKADKEKQSEELMKFYQENKVNPFGGCLPLLVQMPIFIALYNVLGGTAEKPGKLLAYIAAQPAAVQETMKRFWLVLPDITTSPSLVWGAAYKSGVLPAVLAVLPYAILVILFGLSVWLPQYLMTEDPTQRRTGSYMALFMLFIGWTSPAGVLVYWVTSSAWQVGQQMITTRILNARVGEGADAKTASGKPEKSAPAAKQSGSDESGDKGTRPKKRSKNSKKSKGA